jgi:hypothetical protein
MSWSSSMFVGVLTAVVGLLASGFVANLAVGWYRVSTFEAGAAAFVIGFALLGLVVGFIVGVITSRVVAGGTDPGFLKSLGSSQAILLGLVAVVGGSARLLADVPPRIDGEELMLAVEVRWPEGHTELPVTLAGEPYVRLGSVTRANTQRVSRRGPLYTEDARLVDGRWVAPGAVDIFTTRGRFVLDIVLDSSTSYGFLTPLSGAPGRKDMQWTEWYPRPRPGGPPLPNGFTYRYRVQRNSEPVRVETFGPFRVATIVSGFFDELVDGKTRLGAGSEFTIEHGGKPLVVQGTASDSDGGTAIPTAVSLSRADDISAIAAPHPTLLAHFVGRSSADACYLVSDHSGAIRAERVPDCAGASSVSVLTSDSGVFRAADALRLPRGRFERARFATPGLFLVGRSVVDTRSLAVHTFDLPNDFSLVPSVQPLGVSPDERSFARFGYAEHSDTNPAVLVTDAVANHTYVLPIDRARMRFANLETFDPAWLLHHFAWQRGGNGVDSLVERKGFVPIPYHGEMSISDTYRAYRLEPATEGLRTALIDFLVTDMKAERVPVDSGAYVHPVKIDGRTVEVAYGSGPSYLSISMESGVTDLTLLEAIGRRIDAALATGKYDALFGR